MPAGAPWPGSVSDISIENNVVTDSPRGISFVKVGGANVTCSVGSRLIRLTFPLEAGWART